jgi:chromosome segregation and condensation protein ScpB
VRNSLQHILKVGNEAAEVHSDNKLSCAERGYKLSCAERGYKLSCG